MDQAEEGSALGLIAGAGRLPIEAARQLRSLGHRLSVVGFHGLTDPSLSQVVDATRRVRLGQLESMAEALHELQVHRIMLIGKVPKSLLFESQGIGELDAEALRLLSRLRDRGDESLMSAIADWLEARGFHLCRQDELLSPMLAPLGPMSARAPSDGELADFALGRPILREMGRLGVGQCVVVKDCSVMAVEAIEGTDAAITRAGEIGGPGATVIKAARPGQDRRFDLPAVGVDTIDTICAAGASALAIESASALIIDRKAMIEAADRGNIAMWGFPTDVDPA